MPDVLCVGHASYDIAMAVEYHPPADGKMLADVMQMNGGGPAANAAICVARLGGKAGFCGYLDNGLFGTAHLHEFEAEGVDTSLIVRGNYPSPVSQILAKPDGARSVINFKANTPCLPANAVAISHAPKVMLFDGHEPFISISLCQWAKTNEIPTVLDAGSLHQGTRDLIRFVDYLVASEKFAMQYSGSNNSQLALQIILETTDCAVITMGEKGLIWGKDGKIGDMDAFTVDVVDSTGAGDAFHAAFVYGLSLGMNWQALLHYASAAGALACTKLGARIALPNASQVQNLLQGN